MALLHPSKENLNRLVVKLTPGEETLVDFLTKSLDDSYEIYVQPFVNGDHPDIILMRKNSGAMIIEVKDWNIKNYTVDHKLRWFFRDSQIHSPIDQVINYKENLFNLHIEDLLELNIREPKHWGIVTCAVYFHNCTTNELKNTVYKNADEKKRKFLNYIDLIGRDGLTKENFLKILEQRRLTKHSYFFNKKLYDGFKVYLHPPIHTLEQGIPFKYTREQLELTQSIPNREQKIKGVAGCGKTIVLAKRAVNAHKRIGRRILILTYNITLINYIHDRISEVREEFQWGNFYIINYHDFITTEMNNLGIPFEIPDDFSEWTKTKKEFYFERNYYSNERLFENFSSKITKYDAIFIDEVQDFKLKWLRIIKNNFLKQGGEYVLFGDEKQNIFKQQMDVDRKPKTNIPGAWNQTLKKTFRLSTKAAQIARSYQRYFFQQKYDPDEIEVVENDLFENYAYENLNTTDLEKIYSFIKKYFDYIQAHPNDCCILAGKIETLQELDSFIRHTTEQKTQTMFETKEVIIKLFFDLLYRDEEKLVEKALNQISTDHSKSVNQFIKALCYWKYLNHPSAAKKFEDIIAKSKFSIDTFKDWISSFEKSKDKLTKPTKVEEFQFRDKIEIIRKGKKRQFRMNPGTIKLSTIHSFKGWEINNLFLIIENDVDDITDYISAELIYTAITRTRNNLFILNLDNQHFHNFFNNLVA